MAQSINIRKKLVNGNKSKFYLDYYPPIYNPKTGKMSRRETTDFWIYNDFESETIYYTDRNGKKQSKINIVKTDSGKIKKVKLDEVQKKHNKKSEISIKLLQTKRISENSLGILHSKEEIARKKLEDHRNSSFTHFFKDLSNKSKSSSGAWSASSKYFEKFYGDLPFSRIDKKLVEEFKEKLLTANSLKNEKKKLKNNSASSYFVRFVQALFIAHEEGLILKNFRDNIKLIEEEEVEKNFLTIDECRKLFKTDVDDKVLARYCKFALLTGLRFSDIQNLKWSSFENREGKYSIRFKTKKTKNVQYHPLSKEALEIMGAIGGNEEFIFPRIKYHSLNIKLREWIKNADIQKYVTFHNFRTSYAVAQLEAGEDIYIISNLLGHKSVTTTAIYAKIVDERKDRTIDNIILDL